MYNVIILTKSKLLSIFLPVCYMTQYNNYTWSIADSLVNTLHDIFLSWMYPFLNVSIVKTYICGAKCLIILFSLVVLEIRLLLWSIEYGSRRRCSNNPFCFRFPHTICFAIGFTVQCYRMACDLNKRRGKREDGDGEEHVGAKRDKTQPSRYCRERLFTYFRCHTGHFNFSM